jgi:hypothetical protein
VALSLYRGSAAGSDEQRLATQKFTMLLQRSDLSAELAIRTADFLYRGSPAGSDEQRLATQKLLELLKHPIFYENQDGMYRHLLQMIPQFNKLNA